MNRQITLQGILYDEKSSYLKGAALAPTLIREAYHSSSSNYFAENGKEISPEIFKDKGDFKINRYFDIEEITSTNLHKNSPLLTLGGDHSITFPIVKAFYGKYKKLDILHIDAHADLYDNFEGDVFSHACPFARIMEQRLAARLVQVGIRTLTIHQIEQAARYEVDIIQMKDLDKVGIPEFKNPLYISLDMDAFDPAFAPGVSHYELGGLSSRQVIEIIQNIEAKVVGADIVEYNPKRDFQRMTAFLAAKMMKEISGKMMER